MLARQAGHKDASPDESHSPEQHALSDKQAAIDSIAIQRELIQNKKEFVGAVGCAAIHACSYIQRQREKLKLLDADPKVDAVVKDSIRQDIISHKEDLRDELRKHPDAIDPQA